MSKKINEAFAGDKVKIVTGDAAGQEGYVTGTFETKVTVLLSNHKSVEVESDAVEVMEEIDYAERLPVRLPMFESFKAANIRKANKINETSDIITNPDDLEEGEEYIFDKKYKITYNGEKGDKYEFQYGNSTMLLTKDDIASGLKSID